MRNDQEVSTAVGPESRLCSELDPGYPRRTRLAPSPTGSLHLGNLRTFLFAWIVARLGGWSIVLRIEDLDAGRVRDGATDAIVDTLRWLELDWDGPILTQSDDLRPYRDAMLRLAAAQRTYACELSRAEIRAARSAPHRGEHECAFPPELRPRTPADWGFDGGERSHRLVVEPGNVAFVDRLAGAQSVDIAAEVGDFIVWTRDRVPSYQLAVTVDDARQGVTDVIRGDDLLPSAARQQMLHGFLGATPPRWWHLPLVFDAEGRRLAKRDGRHQIAALREAGATAPRTIGLLGHWLGILPRPEPVRTAELLGAAATVSWVATLLRMERPGDDASAASVTPTPCTLPTIVRDPVTLHERDLQWLTTSTATVARPTATSDSDGELA